MESDTESSSSNDVTTEGADQPAISVTNLEKVYGDGDDAVRAVDGVSFDIEEGTAVGLLGPNGAGKTTIIKTILSLIVPTSGRVEVNGINAHTDASDAFQHMAAMLEGARNTYWRLTVRENLEIFSVIGGNDYRKGWDQIDRLLEQFSLVEKEDTVVRELSRGQKQKVSLACTMARNADVVFLDEPTLGLDVESSLDLRKELRRLVENDGRTMLVCSHDMTVIQEVCDRVIIVNDGQIVADDTVENLLELFKTQTYEIRVREDPSQECRDFLTETFDAKNYERRDEATTFEAKVVGDEFYELASYLEEEGLSIVSINSVEPDLEDAFLHITEREAQKDRSASKAVVGADE